MRRPIYRKMSDIKPTPIEVNLDINNDDKSYIDIKTWDGYEDYFVELDRIKDDSEILHWVKHLCGKTWMTPKKIRDFIITIQDYTRKRLLNLKKGLDQVWDIDIWKGDHEEGSKSYMQSGEVIKKSKIKEK